MIKLDNVEGLTGKQIEKIISSAAGERERFGKLDKYYKNDNAINSRTISGGRPNNKLSHCYCKYITNMATGYFMGRGVRFLIEDTAFKETFDEVVDAEYTKDSLFEISKEASKCGIAYELLYINEESKLRSKKFGASEFIPVYSNRVDEFLSGAIRVWEEYDIFADKVIKFAELYTKTEIITFKFSNGYTETERRLHRFSDVPLIVYMNNEEKKGDYEDVISLVDAYDKAQSDTSNDMESFADAILLIIGAGAGLFTDDEKEGTDGANGESSKQMNVRNNRMMMLDEQGQAQWLVKNINDAATENYKNRLRNDMFFLAQVPALSDESFGANLSGVAIKYKLIGLEELSTIKENKFRAALKKKLKFVVEFIKMVHNKEFDANGVTIEFDRNLIENITEIVESVEKLEGIISKKTQIAQLPFVDDPAAEIERMSEESYLAEHAQDAELIGSADAADTAVTAGEVAGEVEEVASKQLNGAQTQSLIAVVQQYASGALTIGQATNIVSAAIGVTKEDARKIIEGLE
jgi:SPP1 family phage portal protein